jgi:hypothetical protein
LWFPVFWWSPEGNVYDSNTGLTGRLP